ncbi:carboxylesterase type B [Hortaea werneckii]|uniref:Carboxylic ester hydrolase n=1 Tax=Hortaea werneckii TaxID=91943 RepID=A0A3M7EUT4_HORWE|nr:carboxylesterase type B [Hortaea werneckii]KAI7606547.1 carboxylesterase type B [Hortaea werneckii]KAI7613113.1 carboxylesterase type B [Hortaea werneckii]KAI7667189.1 carboxylesterase type B [Hortaea werneckii]KAI7693961.1 carboxylesterase type B [Hortaea werneckii]
MLSLTLITALLTTLSLAAPHEIFEGAVKRDTSPTEEPLHVDLGYEVYQGYHNASFNLNTWQGLRYAAPPLGENRWRAPKEPEINRGPVIQADSLPPRCPQGYQAPSNPSANTTGDGDCLFLSVYAPADASRPLPVFFWIHGGGYGAGDGSQDIGNITRIGDNEFVSVVIQYRLGAFGFLSSDEVHQFGDTNGAILDQHFALQWVQQHIHKFGGDPRHVTIAGESAGGGSVMLQALAYGGMLGDSLFENAIASSPYLPMQYPYNGWQPSQAYYAFAQAAGCFPGRAYGNTSTTILDCLRQAPTDVLQEANARISGSGTWGTWAFLPVTDGKIIRERPSSQLTRGQVNGKRVMSGNNAAEGTAFVIPDISTDSDFEAWVKLEYPMLTASDYSQIFNEYYAPAPNTSSAVPHATCGDCGSDETAVNVGSFIVGPQQRAYNLYAETTFVCPSYWLAEAYPPSEGKAAYKYQYSVPAAPHGADLAAEGLRGQAANVGDAFYEALTTMWGNFITEGDPSISNALANGGNGSGVSVNAASDWPVYTNEGPGAYRMLNLNETGGMPYSAQVVSSAANVTQYEGTGLMNDIHATNAYAWEGGRGARCDFWKRIGSRVPE